MGRVAELWSLRLTISQGELLRTFFLSSQEFLHLLFYLKMMEGDIRDVSVSGDSQDMQEPQSPLTAFQGICQLFPARCPDDASYAEAFCYKREIDTGRGQRRLASCGAVGAVVYGYDRQVLR